MWLRHYGYGAASALQYMILNWNTEEALDICLQHMHSVIQRGQVENNWTACLSWALKWCVSVFCIFSCLFDVLPLFLIKKFFFLGGRGCEFLVYKAKESKSPVPQVIMWPSLKIWEPLHTNCEKHTLGKCVVWSVSFPRLFGKISHFLRNELKNLQPRSKAMKAPTMWGKMIWFVVLKLWR